jgi:MFS family permease
MRKMENDKTMQKYVIFACALGSFLTAFLSNATVIASPSIALQFGMSNIQQNWIATIFFLIIAVVSVPAGKLAGKYGLKKSLITGVIIFLLGSIGCALSFNTITILGFRALQGIGGGLLNVCGTALVVSALPPQKRGKGIGLTVAGVYIGLSLAPVIGGFLNYHFGWRSIFYIVIPLLIILLYIIPTRITKEWKIGETEPIDLPGSVIYSIGILFFVYGFTIINTLPGIILTIIGLIGLIGFGMFELRQKYPVFEMRLFKNHKFLSSNIAALISYLATFVITFVINYHLQYIMGMNSQSAGMILIITPLMMAILAPNAGKLSDKINPQKLAALGMSLVTIAILILVFITETTPVYIIVFAMFLQGVGYGLFSSPNTNSVMSSVPRNQTPSASSAVATMRVIGQTLSSGMLTVIFAIIMGSVPIIPKYYGLLLKSSQIACIISVVLCVLAVITSLVGIKSKDKYNTEEDLTI